jgi:hypothetical protein
MAKRRKALSGQAALLPEELETDPRQELLFQTERQRKALALEQHQTRKQAGRLFENKRRRKGRVRFRTANGKVVSFATKSTTTTKTVTKKKNANPCKCGNGAQVVARLELSRAESKRWHSSGTYRLTVIRRAKSLAKKHHGGVEVIDAAGETRSRIRPH